jgi:hypothetical protein
MADCLRRWIVLSLVAALAASPWTLRAAGVPEAGDQAATPIAVIAHPDIGVDNLSSADLRRLLLGDRAFLPSGERVTLFIRAPVARERDVVVRDLCRMTEAQFRQHWIAKVFRADATAGPRIVYSNASAIDQVSRVPGAIAFVAAPDVTSAVKVIRVDGLAPSDRNYPLR